MSIAIPIAAFLIAETLIVFGIALIIVGVQLMLYGYEYFGIDPQKERERRESLLVLRRLLSR